MGWGEVGGYVCVCACPHRDLLSLGGEKEKRKRKKERKKKRKKRTKDDDRLCMFDLSVINRRKKFVQFGHYCARAKCLPELICDGKRKEKK